MVGCRPRDLSGLQIVGDLDVVPKYATNIGGTVEQQIPAIVSNPRKSILVVDKSL